MMSTCSVSCVYGIYVYDASTPLYTTLLDSFAKPHPPTLQPPFTF